MNTYVVVAGAIAGLGLALLLAELVPAGARLDAALARLAAGGQERSQLLPAGRQAAGMRLARRVRMAVPWLPVPAADLALLGQEPDSWLVSKVACGLLGVAIPPLLTALASVVGVRLAWSLPIAASLLLGVALFFAPDLVTRANAAEKRIDFRHALATYLDLVSLERGAGAGPTEALEAAAAIGGGWAFERIAASLAAARGLARPPWDGLAGLAIETKIPELGSLADIAGVAGEEGGRVMDTLTALAESMRTEARATTRAKAGSQSTTMVVPIALLSMGFLLLLGFPIVYRFLHGAA